MNKFIATEGESIDGGNSDPAACNKSVRLFERFVLTLASSKNYPDKGFTPTAWVKANAKEKVIAQAA